MEINFTGFIAPFLKAIDSGAFFGKPFRWLYLIFALLNLLFPVIIMVMAVNNNIFSLPFKFGVTFFLIWLGIALACWFGFQIWWQRRDDLTDGSHSDEFVATPVMAHLIQTTGEWLGVWIGVVGTFSTLVGSIILGGEASSLAYQLNLGFLWGQSFLFAFVFPVVGYLFIVFSRYVSEQIKALAAIANNTKQKAIPYEVE